MMKKSNSQYMKYLSNEIGNINTTIKADQRIEETYLRLGNQVTVKKSAAHNKGFRSAVVAFGAIVVCMISLFVTNTVNPTFAEELPILGGIFKAVNTLSKTPVGTNVDTYETQRINVPMVAEMDTDYKAIVIEGYSDGEYAYASFKIEAPAGTKEKYPYLTAKAEMLLDGQVCEIATNEADNVIIWNSKDEIYTGTISGKLPRKLEDGANAELKLNLKEFLGIPYEGQADPVALTIPAFNQSITVQVDTTNNYAFDVEEKSGEIGIYRVESSPSQVLIQADSVETLEGDSITVGVAALYLEDGTELQRSSAYIGDSQNQSITTYAYDGVPMSTNRLVFRLHTNYDYEKVLAEFTIDLRNQSAKATETYKDKNTPLYQHNPETFSMGKWESLAALEASAGYEDGGPEMLSEEEALEKEKEAFAKYKETITFQNNLAVDDIYIHNNGAEQEMSMRFVTTGSYQDFEVQVLRGEKIICSEKSKDGTAYTEYAVKTGFFDGREEWFNPETQFPHYDFSISVPKGSFSANDTSLVVRAVDPAGKVLMETALSDIEYVWGIY